VVKLLLEAGANVNLSENDVSLFPFDAMRRRCVTLRAALCMSYADNFIREVGPIVRCLTFIMNTYCNFEGLILYRVKRLLSEQAMEDTRI
jgi:hypothetical protein